MSHGRVASADLRRVLTRDREVSRQLVVALLGALAAAATGAASALAVAVVHEGLAIPVLALALSMLALAPAVHALVRRGDLFQPIVLIGFFFFLDFGMRTLLVEVGSELAEPFVFVNIDDARAPAIALAMLALSLIYLGYYAPWWRRGVGRLPRVSMSLPANAPWVVLGCV